MLTELNARSESIIVTTIEKTVSLSQKSLSWELFIGFSPSNYIVSAYSLMQC
jgi:hypothetical protein